MTDRPFSVCTNSFSTYIIHAEYICTNLPVLHTCIVNTYSFSLWSFLLFLSATFPNGLIRNFLTFALCLHNRRGYRVGALILRPTQSEPSTSSQPILAPHPSVASHQKKRLNWMSNTSKQLKRPDIISLRLEMNRMKIERPT